MKKIKVKKLLPLKICPFCEDEYQPTHHFQKFCSKLCKEKDHIKIHNQKWVNKSDPAPRKKRDSNADAYEFFRIKTWYPKNMVFRG